MSLSKLLFIRLYEAEVCVWWCVESNGVDGKREDWSGRMGSAGGLLSQKQVPLIMVSNDQKQKRR